MEFKEFIYDVLNKLNVLDAVKEQYHLKVVCRSVLLTHKETKELQSIDTLHELYEFVSLLWCNE